MMNDNNDIQVWMILDAWLNTESLPFHARYRILRDWLKSELGI